MSKDKEILDQMHEDWDTAEAAEAVQREREKDDYRFCAPETQWDERLRQIREGRGLPCLTEDQLGNFVRLAANGFAQARPMPKVSPVGDGADIETAKIRQGLIRSIMYSSNGDVAIDNAFLQMLRGGVGYARVITEENDEGTLDIKVKRIANRFTVLYDPFFQEPDGCDANFAFIAVDMPRKRFEAEYGKVDDSGTEFVPKSDDYPDWAGDKSVRIVEYYKREQYEEEFWYDEMNTLNTGKVPEGVIAISTGTRKKYKVMWYKATYNKILDKTEWPDEYIPVIPMLGEELIYDGHRTWSGLIRSAKDPQKRINYFVSQETQAIAMAPKAPWIAQADSLINPNDWVSDDGVKVLFWKNINAGGQPTEKPTRDFGQIDIGAITQAKMQAVDALKATTGMFAPSIGMQSGQSGKAIDLLQQQGSTSNGHFFVSAQRFVRHLGRILNNLTFRVMDTPRIVAIIKPDEEAEMVAINQLTQGKNGKPVEYSMTSGKYDVTVDIGPSFHTKRQENKQELTQLMQGPLGQLMAQIAPDLTLAQWDFDASGELMDRVKRWFAMTNPQLVDEQGGMQIPPQVQQQIQQGLQQMQQLQQALQQVQQENQQLKQGQEVKMHGMQMDMQLEGQKAQANMALEAEKAQMDAQLAIQKAQIDAQTKIETARIQAEADIIIARMRGHMELQGQIASTAVNNAMQTGASDVEIEMGGENGEGEYDNGVGNNAGMED